MAAKEERRWRIGYALAPKKQRSFIQASLLSLASSRGIDLVAVDPDLPVVSQGPFDALLHKLSGPHWRLQLQEFSSRFPRTPIIDHPDDIERLHNRLSMLQVVSDLHIPAFRDQETPSSTFGIPNQIVVYDAAELAGTSAVETLRFPMIAKPLVADGSAKSHKMALVFTRDGLLKQKPPLVLQEFVNHGGVIFKVYVVGDHVQCVKRKSLPDVSDEELQWPSEEGSMAFSQISNVTHRSSPGPEDDVMVHLKEAEMPPLGFLTEIARGLRKAMGLHLFNFDVIRDLKIGNHYLVIDINYFPGYAKMPSYETVLTDFFWKIVHGSKKEDESKKEEAAVLDDGDKKEDIRSGKHRHGMKEEVDPSEVQDKVDKKPVG